MSREGLEFRAVRDVPQFDGRVFAAGNQPRPVRAETDAARQAGMPLKCSDFRAVADLPQPNHLIFAARSQQRPVWAETDAKHLFIMA